MDFRSQCTQRNAEENPSQEGLAVGRFARSIIQTKHVHSTRETEVDTLTRGSAPLVLVPAALHTQQPVRERGCFHPWHRSSARLFAYWASQSGELFRNSSGSSFCLFPVIWRVGILSNTPEEASRMKVQFSLAMDSEHDTV